MPQYSKQECAELRELSSEAYEWELGQELQVLDESFRKWSDGEVLSSELSDEIHAFHQHAARELWKTYQSLRDDDKVARGLVIGAIKEDALSSDLLEKIKPLTTKFDDFR